MVHQMSEDEKQKTAVQIHETEETQCDELDGETAEEDECCYYNPCGTIVIGISWILVVCLFPIALPSCLKVIREYERAVIFRLGRTKSAKASGPGLFCILPCTDQFTKIDKRTVSFDIPPQEILTKDNVTVTVNGVVYYRIVNANASIINVENASRSTHLLAQTTLRNVLGRYKLAGILSEREKIANELQAILDEATDPWGIYVERVEVKDVLLPANLQRAMAAEAEAEREAAAKIISADGEKDAAVNLELAANEISKVPCAFQLRYLQTLKAISAEKSSTIVIPLPNELLRKCAGLTQPIGA